MEVVVPVTGSDADDRRLVVTMDSALRAPAPGHELLVAFRFSAERGGAGDPHESIVDIDTELLVGDERYECWWIRGDVSRRGDGDVRVAEGDDYGFVILERDDVPLERIRDYTYAAYRDLLRVVGESRHTRIVKIWNYFPDINAGDGDTEKYRQFSVGRAEALEEVSIADRNMPAGTAVGTSEGRLSIIALTSRHDFVPTENPRQVSAYKYPRAYGPRSPRFSRGGYIATRDHRLFLISGTAAIIGHESTHPYETVPQIGETLENLDTITGAMASAFDDIRELRFDASTISRVYLRDRADLDRVVSVLRERFGDLDDTAAFLRADICRRELMVEIEGVRCI